MVDKSQDFGDSATPVEPGPDPERKKFRVVLKDGTVGTVEAFRLFTSYDANLGLVVQALRGNEEIIGVFYAPLGWNLTDAHTWVEQP